jgi:hypothetical protein
LKRPVHKPQVFSGRLFGRGGFTLLHFGFFQIFLAWIIHEHRDETAQKSETTRRVLF